MAEMRFEERDLLAANDAALNYLTDNCTAAQARECGEMRDTWRMNVVRRLQRAKRNYIPWKKQQREPAPSVPNERKCLLCQILGYD